ncbi:hypothetical protein, partial [uncultured Bacteroides sp.]|uniref:hypothetical protein n=1 Tax=uncultured Bacteroides sp. TaxID=162156 RepID=UPI00259260A7
RNGDTRGQKKDRKNEKTKEDKEQRGKDKRDKKKSTKKRKPIYKTEKETTNERNGSHKTKSRYHI